MSIPNALNPSRYLAGEYSAIDHWTLRRLWFNAFEELFGKDWSSEMEALGNVFRLQPPIRWRSGALLFLLHGHG